MGEAALAPPSLPSPGAVRLAPARSIPRDALSIPPRPAAFAACGTRLLDTAAAAGPPAAGPR